MSTLKVREPTLADIQRQWFDWLEQDKAQLSQHLCSTSSDPMQFNQVRLNVYRNNRFQVLLHTLQQHFPKVLALVGHKYFKQLVRLYTRQQPPNQRNLHSYGLSHEQLDITQPLSFAEFLQNNQNTQTAGLAYLVPLADLESALQSAYFAADDLAWGNGGFSALHATEQMQCQLMLSHSFSLLYSQWDLSAVVNNLQAAETSEEKREEAGNTTLQLKPGEYYFAVYRHASKPQFCALTADEYHALHSLKSHKPELADWLEQHTCAAPALAGWIHQGWITHFKISQAPDHPQGHSKHAG